MAELTRPGWGVKIVPRPGPKEGPKATEFFAQQSIIYWVRVSRSFDRGQERFASNRTVAKKLANLEAKAKRKGKTLEGEVIGDVIVTLDSGTRCLDFNYHPIGSEIGYWFGKLHGKGLASLIELQIQNDLHQRGFGHYMVGRYGAASPSYTKRLLKQGRDLQAAPLKVDRELLRRAVVRGMRKANRRESRKRMAKKVLKAVLGVFNKRRRALG